MFRHSNKAADKVPVEPHLGDGSIDNYDYESGHPRLNGYESRQDVSDSGLMDPDSGVKRGLKNRHLSMMALAGIIGPGLLVGAGGALNSGGPASLLLGFGVIGMSLHLDLEVPEIGVVLCKCFPVT